MQLETDEDRLAALEALGEQISIAGESVWVIFDSEYADALADPGVASTIPIINGRETDLSGLKRDDVIERSDGSKYRVRNSEPDGTGMMTVRLRRG